MAFVWGKRDMAYKVINHFECDRCHAVVAQPETDPSTPPGWQRLILAGTEYLLCAFDVKATQRFLNEFNTKDEED